MKAALVIVAHPDSHSFNHQVFQTVQDTFRDMGLPCTPLDLYTESFPLVLSKAELYRRYSLDETVQRHIELFDASGDIILIYPEWWGMPPAILKGWLDQVLRPGVAYEYNELQLRGLCTGRRLIVLSTNHESDLTPPPLSQVWQHSIGEFCGFDSVHYRVFSGMDKGGNVHKKEVLSEVEAMLRSWFG